MPASSFFKAAIALASIASTANAQSIQQPSSSTSITSFSGQGSIPFQYTPSDSSSVSSINVAIVQDGLDFILANGLLSSGDGGGYSAVFAPISGFCGDVALRVTENQGNSSADPTSQRFTISCGPVQRTRSLLLERQEGSNSGGPSGSLTTPSGGASYNSPDGSIQITYRPVTEGGQTFGIDASLVSDLGNYTLINGLWKTNSSQDISASFAIPSGACGPFNLAITEHQFYQNGAISFQAASPSINISCAAGSDGNTNTTIPTSGSGNSTITSPLPTSTGINATTTASNSTGMSTSSIINSNTTTSTMILTNSTAPLSTSTSTALINSTTSTSLSTITSSINSTTLVLPTSVNSTSSALTSTIANTTSSSQAPATFTGNITLPIEISTITEPTTIVSTVTTTFTQSGQPGILTSVVSTTVSPSSSSSSTTSNSTTSSTSSTSTSTTTSNTNGSGGGIRTTTVTATPSSQSNGITTVTITPTSTPSNTQSQTPERRTSTYTTTEVVVIAQQGKSSITSTRLQTVILVSQTIAAIVQPSQSGNGNSAAPNSNPTGAAIVGAQSIPWSITALICLVTIAIFHRAL